MMVKTLVGFTRRFQNVLRNVLSVISIYISIHQSHVSYYHLWNLQTPNDLIILFLLIHSTKLIT
jgi:hypothetical protein